MAWSSGTRIKWPSACVSWIGIIDPYLSCREKRPNGYLWRPWGIAADYGSMLTLWVKSTSSVIYRTLRIPLMPCYDFLWRDVDHSGATCVHEWHLLGTYGPEAGPVAPSRCVALGFPSSVWGWPWRPSRGRKVGPLLFLLSTSPPFISSVVYPLHWDVLGPVLCWVEVIHTSSLDGDLREPHRDPDLHSELVLPT